MEEFSALASRVVLGAGDVRGCLILSRDGLVLGSHSAGDESLLKPAWLRFAALGEPERGFVQFGDEVWVYARRGPYAGFAVAGPTARPGLVIDQLDQALVSAEELRAKREALRIPETPLAPSGKPRTSLHPEPRPPTSGRSPFDPPQARPPAPGEGGSGAGPPQEPPNAGAAPGHQPAEGRGGGEGEVDRVLLAQEFSRLLQESDEDDEG